MQRPEALWQQFPLDPAATPSGAEQRSDPPPAGAGSEPAGPAAEEAPAERAAPDDAADGRIELPGGAEIVYPAANGTEQAITSTPPAPAAARAPAAQSSSGEPVDVSGQAGLYVLLVAVLVVLMARWLLNHTWRAALTVAVMVLGVAVFGLILMRWATDLGIIS